MVFVWDLTNIFPFATSEIKAVWPLLETSMKVFHSVYDWHEKRGSKSSLKVVLTEGTNLVHILKIPSCLNENGLTWKPHGNAAHFKKSLIFHPPVFWDQGVKVIAVSCSCWCQNLMRLFWCKHLISALLTTLFYSNMNTVQELRENVMVFYSLFFVLASVSSVTVLSFVQNSFVSVCCWKKEKFGKQLLLCFILYEKNGDKVFQQAEFYLTTVDNLRGK